MRTVAVALVLAAALVAAGCGATRGATEERGQGVPAIVVERPTAGQRVESPLVVAGTADVFEANVTVRVLDRRGREIARTFTTASCGTGCRGTFSLRASYTVDAEQEGTLVVQDDDAAGVGRPAHEVRVPVVLVPRD